MEEKGKEVKRDGEEGGLGEGQVREVDEKGKLEK